MPRSPACGRGLRTLLPVTLLPPPPFLTQPLSTPTAGWLPSCPLLRVSGAGLGEVERGALPRARLEPPLGFGLWSLLLLEDFFVPRSTYIVRTTSPPPPRQPSRRVGLYIFHSK